MSESVSLAGIHVTLHENQDGTVDVVVCRGEEPEWALPAANKRVKIFLDQDIVYDGTDWFDEEGGKR